jgi:phosphoribosyl 1,2-cyclic phosphodiesterase
MLIHFWGVRGSLPSPIIPSEIQKKIAAIVNQMVPEDLENAESRARFIAGLPPWLNGTVGGNSLCISVGIEDFAEPIVLDCGSGLREMGIACATQIPAPQRYHVFFSHFHWDHVFGFPFFGPAYNPKVTMDFYSPQSGMEAYLSGIMKEPYFPVRMENMMSKKNFHLLESPFSVGPVSVFFKKMKHPGGSYAYMLKHNGKRFIYATDVELSSDIFLMNEENSFFFKDADLIVLDAQYTLGEAIEKFDWGHSAFSHSVEFAINWGIKHLVLFHHDPTYDDQKLFGILQSAQWYLQRISAGEMKITLAVEGLEITL